MNPAALSLLAAMRTDLGDLETKSGYPDLALGHYEAATELDRRVREIDPVRAEWRFNWATNSASVAQAALLLGDYALARARIEPARTELADLVASEPDNVRWLQNLSFVDGCVCLVAMATGDLEGGTSSCDRVVATTRSELEKDPATAHAAANQAIAETSLAAIALLQGRPAAARTEARRAVDLAMAWNQKQPGEPDWLRILADAELRLAYAERHVGAARVALAAVAGLGEADIESVLATMRADIAVGELGDDDAALRRAVDLGERARALWPRVVPIQGELARAQLVLAARAGAAEAAGLRQQAAALIEPLDRRGALDAELRAELGLHRNVDSSR